MSSPRPGSASSSPVSGGTPTRAREDRLLGAGEIAEVLGMTPRWVLASARSGRMPHVKLGRYTRFVLADVLDWVETLKVGGAPMTPRKHVPRVPKAGTK